MIWSLSNVFLDLFGLGIENSEIDLYNSGLDIKGVVITQSNKLFISSVYSFTYQIKDVVYKGQYETSPLISSIPIGSSVDVLVDKENPSKSTINVGSMKYRSTYYTY